MKIKFTEAQATLLLDLLEHFKGRQTLQPGLSLSVDLVTNRQVDLDDSTRKLILELITAVSHPPKSVVDNERKLIADQIRFLIEPASLHVIFSISQTKMLLKLFAAQEPFLSPINQKLCLEFNTFLRAAGSLTFDAAKKRLMMRMVVRVESGSPYKSTALEVLKLLRNLPC